jgi:hypothetical protein
METTLKQDLLDKISKTNNENLLELLSIDFEYFNAQSQQDTFPELSEKDSTELMEMLDKPFGEDAISFEDFKKVIAQWRTK